MIRDVQFLHKHTCLDMNDFNFMIGFGDPGEIGLHPMTEEEQVEFYKRMRQTFTGTDLDKGVKNAWFAEFTPAYCSSGTKRRSVFLCKGAEKQRLLLWQYL